MLRENSVEKLQYAHALKMTNQMLFNWNSGNKLSVIGPLSVNMMNRMNQNELSDEY